VHLRLYLDHFPLGVVLLAPVVDLLVGLHRRRFHIGLFTRRELALIALPIERLILLKGEHATRPVDGLDGDAVRVVRGQQLILAVPRPAAARDFLRLGGRA